MNKSPIYSKFIPRDISWLHFNARVLQEATDPTVPLIERIRFLGIFSNNLDEFYRVRVPSVKRMLSLGKDAKKLIGEHPQKVLDQIHELTINLQQRFNSIYGGLIKELESNNIFLLNETQLDKEQANFVKSYFAEKVRPTLVPLMLTKGEKFPYLKDKSVYLAIKFFKRKQLNHPNYSLIQIPTESSSRFVMLPQVGKKHYLILLDDVIRFNLDEIYNIFDYDEIEAFNVKITRDSELEFDNDISKSYTQKIESSLKQRKRGRITRFVYDAQLPKDYLDYFVKRMKLDEETKLIPGGGRYHNFRDFIKFPYFAHNELLNLKMPPLPHKDLSTGGSMLEVIKKKDVLLTFPYQKFSHLVDILREAAIDPKVKTIKITLYRIAETSTIAHTLLNAVKNGKKITVVIELQARFDEQNNMYWAQKMQEEGVKVIFGVRGLKVHSKLFMIEREENNNIQRYAHVGTGNFNENTALIYSDFALLTVDPRITDEVEKIFEFFEVNYVVANFNHLLVSPFSMRKKFLALIDQEIKFSKMNKPAYINIKLNNLNDQEMIEKLYQASAAGVKIKMIIRGICSLVPGIKGLSENIEVISIIDRFLEHSRVQIFANGGEEKIYISSGDWMLRNLDQRTEVACPIYDRSLQAQIKKVFEMQWRDNSKARVIDVDRSNKYKKSRSKTTFRSQVDIYNYFSKDFIIN